MSDYVCTNCGAEFHGENCCAIPDPRPVVIEGGPGYSAARMLALLGAVALVHVPTIPELMEFAEDEPEWWNLPRATHPGERQYRARYERRGRALRRAGKL